MIYSSTQANIAINKQTRQRKTALTIRDIVRMHACSYCVSKKNVENEFRQTFKATGAAFTEVGSTLIAEKTFAYAPVPAVVFILNTSSPLQKKRNNLL